MKRLIKPVRIIFVILVLALILSVYVVTLYDLQIVNGEIWSDYAANNRPITKTVEATRGRILDRNGTTLVSNRSVNNIVLDWTALYGIEGSTNDLLLEIVDLVEEMEYTYTDTLPISGSPFSYTEMTSSQEYYLTKYINYYADEILSYGPAPEDGEEDPTEAPEDDVDEDETGEDETDEDELTLEDVSAVQLMAFMRNQYAIKAEYTAEETRAIAGIRYEIDLRYIVGMAEYIFVEDAGVDLITAVLERGYPGVEVAESSMRRYTTTTASHILGRVGLMDAEEYEEYEEYGYAADSYVGKEGIEKDYEQYLHGKNGEKTVTVNSAGTVIEETVTVEAEPGSNVITTLDSDLSTITEDALGTTIAQINAAQGRTGEDAVTAGAAVAIDPNNGDVLAMVSYPSYSLENFSETFAELAEDDTKPLLNRATGGVYTPGSTYKMVTAYAALKSGKITEYTTFNCDGQYHELAEAGYEPYCMGVHGDVDLRQAISQSCNVYFFSLANRLTVDEMADAAHELGLGELTGIGFGEEAGQASTWEAMAALEPDGMVYDGSIVQIGIGQGASQFTPIQLANYTATIANGGTRYQPHLLKEVISYDSTEVLEVYEPEVLADLTEYADYFTAIQEGMILGGQEGTGRSFANFPVTVATKTGTAETQEGRIEDAVFVCYAPAEDPQIAIAVVIEKGGAGSDAIPVARAMLEYFFRSDELQQDITFENTLLG